MRPSCRQSRIYSGWLGRIERRGLTDDRLRERWRDQVQDGGRADLLDRLYNGITWRLRYDYAESAVEHG